MVEPVHMHYSGQMCCSVVVICVFQSQSCRLLHRYQESAIDMKTFNKLICDLCIQGFEYRLCPHSENALRRPPLVSGHELLQATLPTKTGSAILVWKGISKSAQVMRSSFGIHSDTSEKSSPLVAPLSSCPSAWSGFLSCSSL